MTSAHPTSSVTTASRGIEVGSFADEGEPHISPRRFTIATFNIRYAVGAYLITGSLLRRIGVRRPSRRWSLIERHLDEAAHALTTHTRLPPVDILALQEADARTVRAANHHIAPELAARLKMRYAFTGMQTPRDAPEQPKVWYLDFEEHIEATDAGDTGVALLSRLPFAHVERVDLPCSACMWRPRLAVYGRFLVGQTPLHVFNSHIDTHATTGAQLAQHEAVLARVEACARNNEPTVLVGDFNTLTRASVTQVRRFLEARGFQTPFESGTTTWRAGLIRLHTDWIFTRNVAVSRFGVLRPLDVSDHFPVWIEIDASKFGSG